MTKNNSLKKIINSYNLDIVKVEVISLKNKWVLYINNHTKFNEETFKKEIINIIPMIKDIEFIYIEENFIEYINNNKSIIIQNIKSLVPNIFLPQNNWKIIKNTVIIPLILKEDYERVMQAGVCEKLMIYIKERDNREAIFSFEFQENESVMAKEIHHEKKIRKNVVKKKEISKKKEFNNNIIFGKKINNEVIKIIDSTVDEAISIEGTIFNTDFREIRNNKVIISFNITDFTSSLTIKIFVSKDKKDTILSKLNNSKLVKVKGKLQYDTFAKENILIADSIQSEIKESRSDNSELKRVELHLHTQYSSMDSVAKISQIIERANEFGHKTLAITDHGVLQAFPDAMEHAKKNDMKIIYGIEGYLVNDNKRIKWGVTNNKFDEIFIVFDLETTGLSSRKNEIIEIGAVKVKNHQIIETFNAFVKPNKDIPIKITELTGITNDMVKNEESIEKVLPEFIEFCKDHILVAHNAKFDISFIENACNKLKIEKEFTVIDTLSLSRNAIPNISRHNLKSLSKYYKIKLDNHHRALDDALTTAKIFINLIKISQEKGAVYSDDLNTVFNTELAIQRMDTTHVIILVKNYTGLKNLYKLVSESHLKYFYKKPRIPKSILSKYREGLLIGSACENSELFKGILSDMSEEELSNIVSFYDYLEIQPLGNNQFLIDNDTLDSKEDLIKINKKILELGESHNKIVVATGDVHFLDKEDEYFRRILMHGQGFSDAEKQPPLYYRTTEEMLAEFYYLEKEKAEDVVIHNTNKIADSIESIDPIPNGTFPPIIPGSDEEIKDMVYENAYNRYGNPLPEIVEKRINKELDSIIKNGYSVLYLVAHKLVNKSLNDGYLVGSRGSVGSSLVATFCNITEVNPLQPHYICPKCKNSEFFDNNEIGVGPDLPEKKCSNCGEKYDKDGFDIPFEVFLGFDGDKEPDIDLNFSGEYQSTAHKYTEELFGEGKVYRAGTISTIAERTAYGFAINYLEEKNKPKTNAEIDRLVKGCSGIKKTTGQHPGGIMVVPENKEIFDFCPIQKPADDMQTKIITTHFDYHSISGRLLKLDILGHDDPTVIKMLEDLTQIDAKTIPLDDKKTMSIFTTNNALDLVDKETGCQLGNYGIPEFGTNFVKEMLLAIKPTAFADLIKISGLSHGTDVWLNNAQSLIKDNIATIKDVICTRDDIMSYLINKGLPSINAFSIMEKVRKGKGLNNDDISLMKENNIPSWYIESCNKIKYMFPKAHAVAYVTMAFRIAYFKVHYPLAYYATYFSIRADEFDAHIAIQGKPFIKKKIIELKEKGNSATTKEKSLQTILELVLETLCRGYEFLPVNLMESHFNRFIIKDGCLLPPFNSLEGIGDKAAYNLYISKEQGEYISVEDLQKRAKLSKTNIDVLNKHGVINFLPQSNQISLF
ncbi:MAG: PolC-type DNA polymerase III [Eubacteriaceae bacterium]